MRISRFRPSIRMMRSQLLPPSSDTGSTEMGLVGFPSTIAPARKRFRDA